MSWEQPVLTAELAAVGATALLEAIREVDPDIRFFGFDEIPWQDLAFPSVHWALGTHRESAGRTGFAPFVNPPGEIGDLKQAGL